MRVTDAEKVEARKRLAEQNPAWTAEQIEKKLEAMVVAWECMHGSDR